MATIDTLEAMVKRWESDMAKLTPADGEDDLYGFVRESLGKTLEDMADAIEERAG